MIEIESLIDSSVPCFMIEDKDTNADCNNNIASCLVPCPDIIDESFEQSQKENNPNLSNMETPSKRQSLIPTRSTVKKQKAVRESFETPNLKMSKERLEQLFQSGIRKSSNLEVEQTPSKKLTKSELSKFIKRSNDVDEQRKQKQEKLKKTQEEKVNQEISNTNRKISKKKIKELTERLSSQTPSSKKFESEIPPKTPCQDPLVFQRLYIQSTCKKAQCDDDKKEIASTTLLSNKSELIVMKKSIKKINDAFENISICEYSSIIKILENLYIIDSSTNESEMEIIKKVLEKCKSSDSLYDGQILRSKMIKACKNKKCSKFTSLINTRLSLARANEKTYYEIPEEVEEPIKVPKTMHRETFDRLLSTKPVPQQTEEQEEILLTNMLSEASKQILNTSERTKSICKLSIEEREKILGQKKGEELSKLEKELQEELEKELQQKPQNLGIIPEYLDSMPIESRKRTKKDNDQLEEPSFRPKVNAYEDYQRKSAIQSKIAKPSGWEESIERMRLGRLERNEMQMALDIRAPMQPTKNTNLTLWKKKVHKTKKPELIRSSIQSHENTEALDSILGL